MNHRTFSSQTFCSHLEQLIRQLCAEAERTKPLAVATAAAAHNAKTWLDERQVRGCSCLQEVNMHKHTGVLVCRANRAATWTTNSRIFHMEAFSTSVDQAEV